jgi:hypothetical protein
LIEEPGKIGCASADPVDLCGDQYVCFMAVETAQGVLEALAIGHLSAREACVGQVGYMDPSPARDDLGELLSLIVEGDP